MKTKEIMVSKICKKLQNLIIFEWKNLNANINLIVHCIRIFQELNLIRLTKEQNQSLKIDKDKIRKNRTIALTKINRAVKIK